MPDPTPFLSTIAATSAAMVAIVGGLLVARFVTIGSEQEGAQQLLDDAASRLTIARKREQEAHKNLRNWYINEFFEIKIIRAVGEGERDILALRRVGGYTPLTDNELAEAVQIIAGEFEKARSTLRQIISSRASTRHTAWTDFKYASPSLPEIAWDEVWEIVYESIVRPHQSTPQIWVYGAQVDPPLLFTPPQQPEFVALDIQRRDALRTDVARAKQRTEDIEEEFGRLQRARAAIVRPKGLGGGLVVLAFFTLVGVIIPIWLMSRAPKRLTAHLGEVVFWLFLAGLLALLGYMGAFALRLSGWHKNTESENREQGTLDA